MSRIYNFSPGPATLPEDLLKQAQAELLDWRGTGCSVMEMGHRTSEMIALTKEIENDLRELLTIPSHYHVLFLSAGASAQFAFIPMNLLRGKRTADYCLTGHWSQKAIYEARRYCDVNIATDSTDNLFTNIAPINEWRLNRDAAYVHYTPNETIAGLEFNYIPDTQGVPLVADMSSNILSQPLDVSKFGLIYACAQKNIGPAGMTIVIVRDDLVGQALPETPTLFDYAAQAKEGSMANTPPTLSWYFAGLMFKWLKQQGGLAAIATINQRKAAKLYAAIDQSSLYQNSVATAYRSIMNVPFVLKKPGLDEQFLQEARAAGLGYLKGHKLVGGMRASIYNSMPEAGVDALIEFMQRFEENN